MFRVMPLHISTVALATRLAATKTKRCPCSVLCCCLSAVLAAGRTPCAGAHFGIYGGVGVHTLVIKIKIPQSTDFRTKKHPYFKKTLTFFPVKNTFFYQNTDIG